MAKCAFLGLGVMGFPMAGHLVAAGHEVRVWNRSNRRAMLWGEKYEGTVYDDITKAVKGAEFVMICVGDDPDVFDVFRAALPSMAANTVVIDHTTCSADCARTCYSEAKEASVGFIDAPISGGEAGAKNGQLSVMCGGDEAHYDAAKPIMDAYAKAMTYLGESGSGQLTKMVNQICIAGVLQGLAEGVNFAQKAGLDMETVLQAIGKGAAQSWQMDNRALTMDKGEYEFGFAVDWMRKDLRIALETGKAIEADLTLAAQVDSYYADVQDLGGARWDTSSLLVRLQSGKPDKD